MLIVFSFFQLLAPEGRVAYFADIEDPAPTAFCISFSFFLIIRTVHLNYDFFQYELLFLLLKDDLRFVSLLLKK